MSTTFETVKKIIVELIGVEPERVTMDADLVADIGMDSLDSVEVLMAVEDEIGVLVDDEQADKIVTVADAVALIDSTRAAA